MQRKAGFVGGYVAVRSAKRTAAKCSIEESIERKQSTERDKRIAKLAAPSALAMAVEPLMGLVDTAFVGHIGTAPLAGVGIATFLIKSSTTAFSFVIPVTTSMVAGAKNDEERSDAIRGGLCIWAVAGALVAALVTYFAPALTAAMAGVQSASSIPYAVTYLRWRALGIPAVVCSLVLAGSLRGVEDTPGILKAALLSNLVNVSLDYITIFWLGWGVAGAAIATTASQVVNAGIMAFFLARRGALSFGGGWQGPLVNRNVINEYVSGSVLLVRTLANLITWTSASRVAATMGTAQVAAFEVGKQVWSFQVLLMSSLHIAANSLVGNEVAKGNDREARLSADRCIELGVYMSAVLGALAIFMSKLIPKIFISDPLVLGPASDLLRTAAWSFPAVAASFIMEGCFLAKRRYQWSTGSNLIASGIACAFLYGLYRFTNMGVSITFIAINLLFYLRMILLAVRYFSPRDPLLPIPGESISSSPAAQGGTAQN